MSSSFIVARGGQKKGRRLIVRERETKRDKERQRDIERERERETESHRELHMWGDREPEREKGNEPLAHVCHFEVEALYVLADACMMILKGGYCLKILKRP